MSRDKLQSYIQSLLSEGAEARARLAAENTERMEAAIRKIHAAFKAGGKVLVFGNGGSAADAQHMAAELVGRFLRERPGLPAIALTPDSSIVTALGNDFGFETIFARQMKAMARLSPHMRGRT